MGTTLTWERTENNGSVGVTVNDTDGPETGATVVARFRDPDSADLWLDHNDSTWKANAAVTTLDLALGEVDATDAPGRYEANLDFAATIASYPAASHRVEVIYVVTAPTGFPTDVDTIEIVNHYLDVAISTDILSDATPFAGANVDVAISLVETEASAATREATNTAEHAATLAAVGLVETEAAAAAREVTNTAEHAATLIAVSLNESEASASARAATNQAEHDATQLLIGALPTPPTVAAIADQVWDEAQTDHTASGSMGRSALLALYASPIGPAVYIDPGAANVSTVLGTDGTPNNPVGTQAAASTLATALGTPRARYILSDFGTLTLTQAEVGGLFYGLAEGSRIALGGQVLVGCQFVNLTIEGSMTNTQGYDLTCHNCLLAKDAGNIGPQNISGKFFECELGEGPILIAGSAFFDKCQTQTSDNDAEFDMNGATACTLRIFGQRGQVIISNANNAADHLEVNVDDGSKVVISNDVLQLGTFRLGGVFELENNSLLTPDTSGRVGEVADVYLGQTTVHGPGRWDEVTLAAGALAAILDEDVTGREASPDSLGRVVDLLNKIARGRARTNPTLQRFEIYDPVDDTLLLTYPLTDFGGDPIVNVAGSPFDRGKATEV